MLPLAAGITAAAWQSGRRQRRRLLSLETACHLREASVQADHSPQILGQALTEACTWRGKRIEWGLYYCPSPDADELVKCVSALLADTRRQFVYYGQQTDRVAVGVLRRAIERGADPRGRLGMPDSLKELECLLESGKVRHPVIVADNADLAADLAELRRRYGCAVILFGQLPEAAGYATLARLQETEGR